MESCCYYILLQKNKNKTYISINNKLVYAEMSEIFYLLKIYVALF